MTSTQTSVVMADILQALEQIDKFAPTVLSIVGTFYPPVAVVAKFLPLIEEAIKATEIVAQATGDATTAQATVIQHLTPGQPNAPALS